MESWTLPGTKNFSFRRTLYSHGWADLDPFQIDDKTATLKYICRVKNKICIFRVSSADDRSVTIETAKTLPAEERDILSEIVRHMFRLDEDLEEFFALAAEKKVFAWVAEMGAGRLMRCAGLWEDMVKMVCTTNCTWRLTQIMTTNLVEKLGSGGAFPTPRQVASGNENFLREEVKTGYRSPYLLEFAQKTCKGEIDLEEIAGWQGTTADLYKKLRSIKGFGDYAVSNLLKLLGRYDYMGMDSWSRKKFAEIHRGGEACDDREIVAHYAEFGKWGGLFFWMDMTKEWHEKPGTWE